jgi:hypothetical protein
MDRNTAVLEQLIGFIMNKILDPGGELYQDSHINRQSTSTIMRGLVLVIETKMIARYISSTCNHDICIFINIIMSN